MTTPTATQLARLKRQMQSRGVTQKAVAERAQVSKFHVCHVLAGRVVSAPVIRTAKELLAETKRAAEPVAVGLVAALLLACR